MAKPINSLVNLDDENTQRIWLEELKDAVNSTLPIYDETLTTDKQTVVITGLDIKKHGGYHIEFLPYNDSGGAEAYSFYLNDDTTASNYRTVASYTIGGATPTAAQIASDSILARATVNRETTYLTFDISSIYNTDSSGYEIRGIGHEARRNGNNVIWGSYAWVYNDVITDNVTKLTISATGAKGIGANSIIRIWRKV